MSDKPLSKALKRGLKPGVTCCIHCGETKNLRMVLPPKDDLYCPKHYEECAEWFRRKLGWSV